MIKTFFYIEFVAALALIRSIVATGRARRFALLSLGVALIGIAANFLPPLIGLTGTDWARIASRIVNQGIFETGSGMALPIAVSALFALSWRAEGRRWWALDALHLIAALGFFGLWVFTKL